MNAGPKIDKVCVGLSGLMTCSEQIEMKLW